MKKISGALILVFLFFLPWQTRLIINSGELAGGYWEYGTVSIYASWILLAAALAANGKNILRKIKEDVRAPWLLFLAFLIVFSGISAFWSLRPEAALVHSGNLLAGALLVILIWANNVSFYGASSAFVLGAGFQAALGVLQFSMQKVFASSFLGIAEQIASRPGVSVVEWAGGRLLRAHGGLPHPNILGGFLAVALILCFVLSVYEQNRRRKAVWAVLLAVILAGLILSFSRSAWLAAGLGALAAAGELVYVYRDRTRTILSAVISIFLLAILYSFLAIGPVSERFFGDSRLESLSRKERISSIGESFAIIRQNLFFGAGAGNYTAALHRIEPGRNFRQYQPVHTAPILILSELGVLGLIFAVCFIIFIIRGGRHGFIRPLAILWLPLAFFDHYLWSLYSGIMLTFFVFGSAFFSARKLQRFDLCKRPLDKI